MMEHVSFITNIALDSISGGFSAMNRAMFDVLSKGNTVDYIGPVNPNPDWREHTLSKARRLLGMGGNFFFFSERRLERIREGVEARLSRSKSQYAVFHGFTPWIHIRPDVPYMAWSDCTFWQYVHIYHDARCFRRGDLIRIRDKEACWLRKAESVVFRSHWAASEAIKDYDLDKERVVVVGNYGFLEPPNADRYETGKDFLMVTTNFRQKGGPIAIRAFRLVRKQFPEARLLIIGDSPGRTALREPGVVYLGWIDKSNVDDQALLRKTLTRARCLLHPTVADTNPVVIIEAGYFGCPAISTKRYAIPELVRDGVSGILLNDPTNVTDLAQAMTTMLAPSSKYSEMREAARAHMLGYFTKQKFEHRMSLQVNGFGTSLPAVAPAGRAITKGKRQFDTCRNLKQPQFQVGHKRNSSLPTVNFITNIPVEEISGGFSGMSFAAYEALKSVANVNYVGPVNPPIDTLRKYSSKIRRMAGVPGEFFFFSEERLERIAREVSQKCIQSADFDFYHGFTPWVCCRSARPYAAWSDCSFLDYLTIYHNPREFRQNHWEQVCCKEKDWLSSAQMVLLSSDWAVSRVLRDYGLSIAQVQSVGIFGAIEPPVKDVWEASMDFYFISTDYEQKDGSLCRRAMDIVWERYPEACLRIVGAKPPSRDLVPDKVTYEGFYRKSDPTELKAFRLHLANAFALLHPTKADTTAMIVIEAAFFGCPAISVDDFALREVTSDFNSKLLLKRPLSVEALAEAMMNLLSDRDYYIQARKAARDYATTYLTREEFKLRLAAAVGACLDVSQKE